MLESMVAAPVPTRAESSDVANAVFDGSSSVMLSGETAIGIDPVNAVDTMAEIAQRADEEFDSDNWLRRVGELRQDLGRADKALVTTDAITMAAARIAHQVEAKAILCLSRTGFTARAISRFRQDTPILCFSPEQRTVHQLSLSWGVDPIPVTNHERPSEMIDEALHIASQRRELSSGDTVVVISGQTTRTRATDSLRVVEIP
jgi:pyruvate kinase